VVLPFEGAASDVLVDDADRDGNLDLAFTTHAGNQTQIFYQREPRRFEAGPTVRAVGYHPGNLTAIPGEDPPLYLMSAEGESGLLTLSPEPSGGLAVVAKASLPHPRFTRPFSWPNWGLGIVAARYSPPAVILLKDYDPRAPKAKQLIGLPLRGIQLPVESFALGDLDGDGVDEIVFATPETGKVWTIRYPGRDGTPTIGSLWESPPLGAARHVATADLDRDGRTDLIVPDDTRKSLERESAAINLLLNRGEQGFELMELAFPPRPAVSGDLHGVRTLDSAVDRDGHRYIFAAGYSDFAIYRLPLDGDLRNLEARVLRYAQREANFKVALADVDGDGWLDAVVGRGRPKDSGLVIFGPLWEELGRLAEEEVKVP